MRALSALLTPALLASALLAFALFELAPTAAHAGGGPPRIELEDADRPLEPGALLQGRVKGLGEGRHVLVWRDRHGVRVRGKRDLQLVGQCRSVPVNDRAGSAGFKTGACEECDG